MMDEVKEPDEIAEPGPPEVEAPPIYHSGVFKCVVDCDTGETRSVELTEDEVADAAAERSSIKGQRETVSATETAAREADLTLVVERAKTDPDFAALARLAGVDIPEVR